MKSKFLSILALLCITASSAWAQYNVTKDATMSEGWTISPTNPVTTGTAVKATYNGSKHVKRVKYVWSKALADVTAEDVGKVIAANGRVYQTVSDVPAGTTATAMIAYVGQYNDGGSTYNHGIAVALTDVSNTSGDEGTGTMTYNDAVTAAAAYKRTRPSSTSGWVLPNAYQWERIFIACGGNTAYISPLQDNSTSFSYGDFRKKLTDCGGTDVLNAQYSTCSVPSGYTNMHWAYRFDLVYFLYGADETARHVRPVLCF